MLKPFHFKKAVWRAEEMQCAHGFSSLQTVFTPSNGRSPAVPGCMPAPCQDKRCACRVTGEREGAAAQHRPESCWGGLRARMEAMGALLSSCLGVTLQPGSTDVKQVSRVHCPVHWFPVCTASNALLDLEKSLTCRFMDAVREYAEAGLQSVCTFFLFPFLFDAGHWRKQGMMPCPVVWFRVLLLCAVVPLNRSKFKPQPAAGNATWQTLSGWRGSGKVASPVFCSGNWKQSILPLYPTCSLSQKRSRGAVKLKMFFSVGWDQAMDILRDPVGVRDRKEGKQRGYEGGKGKTSCKGLVLWH